MIKKLTLLLVLTFFSVSLFAQDAPTYLSAIEGDEEVTLFWQPPGVVLTEGETCALPIQGGTITDGFSENFSGTTVGFEDDYVDGYSANGPDVVYEFTVDGNLDVIFFLCDNATWDTYLILLGSDCETQIASDDDGCGEIGGQSEINGTLGSGTYFLVVDGWSSTSEGEYTLSVSATASDRTSGVFQPSVTDENKLNNRDLTGSEITPLDEYTAGIDQTLDFNFHIQSPDIEYGEGFILTFPEDWVVVGGTMLGIDASDVSGNIITFGDPYAASGWGPYPANDYPFEVTLSAPASGGDVTVDYFIGGDTYGAEPHSIEGSFTLDEDILETGDLIGYNTFVDGSQHNTDIIGLTNYTVDGLVNNTTYELGVTAVYYVNENETEESEPVTISATPTYLFGDLTGVVTDPNGGILDSVVVSSGNVSDTTDGDGVYTLWNLNTGSQTVTVSRLGFYSVTIDTTVLAQAEPTVLDVVLSPDMKVPHDLTAKALDEQVYLEWYTPAFGGSSVASLQGTWSIVGDWYCDAYGTFTSDFTFNDDGTFSYPDYYGQTTYGGTWGVESGTVELSAGVCDAVTFEFNAWVIFDYYLTTYYIMHDGEEGFGVMDSGGDGSNDGDLLATRVSESTNEFTVHALHYNENSLQILGEAPDNISEFSWVTVNDLLNREELLLEYRVYQVDTDGLETFVVATAAEDTFATVTASPNYLEYCYNVSAYWATDNYGDLESRHSNVACTTPIEQILTMTPEDGDEFAIGSSGGSFGFNALLVNPTDETKFYEAYLWAQLPNENWYGPIAPTPVTVRVRPGRQVSVNLNQRVPGGAPDGWYYFSGEIYLDGHLADEDGFWFWKGDPQSRGTEPISGNQELVARTRANVISDADDSEWISFYDEYGVEAKRGDVWTDEGLYHADGVAISVLQLSAVTLPNLYQLHQNYPNPFNPVTTLRYDLPEDALVNITIYDLMGHSVRSLVNSRQTAGYRSIQWDATNNLGEPISAGMYIYTIQAGEFKQTKKMVLLK